MAEMCPLEKCEWQHPVTGKCTLWPCGNCPRKDEREGRVERIRAVKEAQERQRLIRRKERRERAAGPVTERLTGVRQLRDKRWMARICAADSRKRITLGVFDTADEAVAVRIEAEKARDQGVLDQWLRERSAR